MSSLSRIIGLYRAEIELLWKWRLGRWALIKRGLVALVAALLAINLTAWLAPGLLSIDQVGGGVLAILFISALNLVIRPVLVGLVARHTLIGLVVLTVLFQAVAIWLITPLIPGVTVYHGFLGALAVSIILGILQGALGLLFGLGQGDFYYGKLVRTLAAQRPDSIKTDQPGLVIIQVDGVAHEVLVHSIRAGRVPFISKLIRSGSHKLAHWTALLPSTTPASQAGILHGNNDGIPNFRWWEKEHAQLLVANHPDDATVIEQRISDGEGLLSPGGASISNIFTGDGDRAFLVMSAIKVKERGLGASNAFAYYFASPYSWLTMLGKFIAEVIKELVQAWRQRRAGIEPMLDRGFPYPFVRASTNVALRALGTSLVMEEMMRGTPVIYMDYTDYDEIAHHSGPERPESLDALDGVDRELATLARAAEDAPRPYRFVLLADHGQSLGSTFLQRYGETLQDVVRSLMGGEASVAAATAEVEDWGPLNTFAGEVSETSGVAGSVARTATRNRTRDGQVDLRPEDEDTGDDATAETDLVVVAGGNLALVYFGGDSGRLTLEQIEERYPGLVGALANHPGVGVLIVRSAEHGLACIGEGGANYLEKGRVEGVDPLAVYGEHAEAAVRRLDDIEHVGDIGVISFYDSETGEVAAFEELIGAHGGLGGAQTKPFIVHPAEWEMDLAPLLGAPAVYQQLRRWMEDGLGMTFGATERDRETGPSGDGAGPV